MSALRIFYLIMVVVGAYMPMSYFLQWFGENGYSMSAMINAWHVNAATSGLVWDLSLSAVVLSVWIIAEVYVRKDFWVALVCILATFCIGVSCGLPLYLFLRTRASIKV
jgi:hypothetical protein